tara:strand:- start:57 stop:377 length:321 start_codon:yes stop_codon:yes gene_type:complete
MCLSSGDIINVFNGYAPGDVVMQKLNAVIADHKAATPTTGSGTGTTPDMAAVAGSDASEKAKAAIANMAKALVNTHDKDGDGKLDVGELTAAGEQVAQGVVDMITK